MQASTLSVQLREGTKEAHTRAERSSFMMAFFHGQVPREGYRRLLARLLPVYETLENCQKTWAEHPALGNLYFPQLFRVEALKQDLAFYYGAAWPGHIHETPAVTEYTGRIAWLARHWPTGLAAHHYTRYLGDLSGGQMIKRMVQKAYGLEGSAGVAFYEFPAIDRIAAFKTVYRQKMDALPLVAGEASRLVEEANRAFDLNVNLFRELDELRKAA